MAGDPTYLSKAAQGGKFNGQCVGRDGVSTLAPKLKGGVPDLGGPSSADVAGLDQPQKGSQAGVLKSGKSKKSY